MPHREKLPLSYEFREELAQLMRQCCPCAMDDPARVFYLGVVAICETEVQRQLAKERVLPPHVRHGRPPRHRDPAAGAPQPHQIGRLLPLIATLRHLLITAYRKGVVDSRDDNPLDQSPSSWTINGDQAVNNFVVELILAIKEEAAAALKARLNGREGGHA